MWSRTLSTSFFRSPLLLSSFLLLQINVAYAQLQCPEYNDHDGILTDTQVIFDIASENSEDHTVPHILNSITITTGNPDVDGVYSKILYAETFESNLTTTRQGRIYIWNNGEQEVDLIDGEGVFNNAVLEILSGRNLNQYVNLSGENYTDKYISVGFNTPFESRERIFLGFPERNGNNPLFISAYSNSDVLLGTVAVTVQDYVDTEHDIGRNQNGKFAIFPIDDIAPLGTAIKRLELTFGPTATGDAPDTRLFIFDDNESYTQTVSISLLQLRLHLLLLQSLP